jgi:sugar-specific transcriptional regulator TrmB
MALKPTNNVIETLKMLGLTGTQARIYFFILKEGHVTARHVSKDLSIARETVYHTLSTLDELGLIVKHLTASPTLYEVLSAKDAITVLLQNKKQEYSKASKTANNMNYPNIHLK